MSKRNEELKNLKKHCRRIVKTVKAMAGLGDRDKEWLAPRVEKLFKKVGEDIGKITE